MKKIFILLFFSLFISSLSVSQIERDKKFYIGIGTTFSSYLGGDFGSTFAVRYSSYRDNYYYDNYYYNRHYSYNDYNNYGNESFFPLQFDLAFGINASKIVSFQIESSILWHLNGRPNRYYETGTIGNYDYIDRNDNAELISIPIMASIKVFPFGRKHSSFYLTGGYGIQYIQESVDRIRELYNYNSYWNNYSSSSEYLIASYRERDWFHGIKIGLGFDFKLSRYLRSDVELKVTNFFPSTRNNLSNLSMYRTPNITNIALGAKIFFEL